MSLPWGDSCRAVPAGQGPWRCCVLVVSSPPPRPQPSKKLSSVLCKLLRLKFSDLKHRETWSKLEVVLAGFKRKITYK